MSTSTMNRNFARNTANADPRTAGQVNFIRDLITQIAKYNRERGLALWAELRDLDRAGQLSFSKASSTISALKAERAELRIAAHGFDEPAIKRPKVPEGRYAVDTDEGHLGFYRVNVADNGFITVSVQASSELHQLSWKAAVGVLRKIEADPQAAAIRYGKELGVCGVCARPLTNPESRSAGIGPKCAQRF